MTELARKSGISYNSMKKYVRIMNERDDEYYTVYECVESEFRRYVDYLNDKTVYCPCDSNDSNIVQWLKKNTTANVINTWDDYRNHSDLFESCQVIVTNGPFSEFKEMFDYFRSFNKDFFLVAPLNSIITVHFNNLLIAGELFIDRPCTKFNRPDGTIKELYAIWITNIDPKFYTHKIHLT